MTIPAVMFIEMAMDTLKSRDFSLLNPEAKEFMSMGDARLSSVRDSLLKVLDRDIMTKTHMSVDMLCGYLLGIETMRMLLATNPKAVQAGVGL